MAERRLTSRIPAWLKRPSGQIGAGAGALIAVLAAIDGAFGGLSRVKRVVGAGYDFVNDYTGLVVCLLFGVVLLLGVVLVVLAAKWRNTRDELAVVDYGPKVEAVSGTEFARDRAEIAEARIAEIKQALQAPAKTLLVSGIANELLTSRLGESEELKDFFERGGTLRAIFIDPAGGAVQEREVQEGHPDERMFDLSLKSAMNIAALRLYRRMIRAANDTQGAGSDRASLEIKVQDRAPALNLIIVDDRWASIHHYGVRTPGSRSPRITVDLLEVDDDDSADEDKLTGIEASRASLNYYCADFQAQWNMADDLDEDSAWLRSTSMLDWVDLKTITVDGRVRLENPSEDGRIANLNRAIIIDHDRRMATGTALQVMQQQLDEKTALLVDLKDRLADADRRAKSEGDLDGVRLRTFANRTLRGNLVADRIRAAKSTIDVVGVVNEMVTSDLLDEDFFWPFLNGGGRLRALFINPRGEAVHRREALERIHQDRVIEPGDFAERTQRAVDFFRRYRDSGSEVWVYERQPSMALLIIDGTWALVTHYGHTQKGVTTPAIEIDLASAQDPVLAEGLLTYFAAEFEALLGMDETSRWAWGSPDG